MTGAVIGTPLTFDPHATSGELRGLLDIRDNVLVGLGEELGALMQSLSLAINSQHNANGVVPPPPQLDGRQTGLLAGDALNFSGATTIGIADANGILVHNIAIDFDAGTISVDGGGASSIGTTIGSFAAALNTALGANGDADFTNGVLTVSANGGNGLVISDDAGNPSSRAGIGFSHFFGLNDLYRAEGNAIQTTGLASTDAHGLAPGGDIMLLLKGPDGRRVSEVTVAVTGTTIGDMVSALNTAFAGNATFALDANGQLQVTPAPGYERYELEVRLDTTQRGGTGESFTSLFGIGTGEALARASAFSLSPEIAGSAQRLAFAQPTLTATTALGTSCGDAGRQSRSAGSPRCAQSASRFRPGRWSACAHSKSDGLCGGLLSGHFQPHDGGRFQQECAEHAPYTRAAESEPCRGRQSRRGTGEDDGAPAGLQRRRAAHNAWRSNSTTNCSNAVRR